VRNKLVVALTVFVIWILITLFGPGLQIGSQNITLNDLVSHAIALWLAGACVFLLVVVGVLGWWRQVGLRAPAPRSWRLTWLPFVFILIFLATAALIGFPAPKVVMIVLINTLLVGISEELMTRGVLFVGVLSRFGIWSTIVIVSVLFGAMHLGNGFITGDLEAAAVQALAAAMSGLLFIALRMRTNSLVPGIVVHWLWDFSAFMITSAGAGPAPVAPEPSLTLKVFFPLLLATPGFIYGLWLLRHIGKRDKAEFVGA
jgi:membrane protease YdiL (CAAX protease family)